MKQQRIEIGTYYVSGLFRKDRIIGIIIINEETYKSSAEYRDDIEYIDNHIYMAKTLRSRFFSNLEEPVTVNMVRVPNGFHFYTNRVISI